MKPQAAIARGKSLLTDGRTKQALGFLQTARRDFPANAEIALLLADALHASKQLREAVAAYETALLLDDRTADGWFSLGCAQLALKAHGAARHALARAAILAPDAAPVHYNLAKAQFELGFIEAAIESYERAAATGPEMAQAARAGIATIIPGSPAADNQAVLRARKTWAKAEAATLPPAAPSPRRESAKRRIGYVSAFFGERNWMKPVMAMVNHHDRDHFEIHFISDGKPPSAEAGYRDHDADYVHDFRTLETGRAAEIIHGIGIDVLVDLNGYGFASRLPLMMQKPARHLVGWFNMFATTGIAAFDWIIGDDAVAPAAEAPYYSEKIHRLPGSYLAFECLYPVPDVAPPPCGAWGVVTFGCFGSQYKLTDGVITAFARILAGAPGAKLFLKNGALEDASTRADLLHRLRAAGVEDSRVMLSGRSEHYAFLETYDLVDIALDTFPYNGGTTTTEALWQGVPVLTFDGDRWASRTSKSLLRAAGLDDWVMADEDTFVARAIELANNPQTPARLAELRRGMRARLSTSAVCDAAGMCRALENFYREISTAPQ